MSRRERMVYCLFIDCVLYRRDDTNSDTIIHKLGGMCERNKQIEELP